MKRPLTLTESKFLLADELERLKGLYSLREADDYQVIRIGAHRIACYITDELIAEQEALVAEARAHLQHARDVL